MQALKCDNTTRFSLKNVFARWISRLCFDGERFAVNGINMGHVVFSGRKIEISSCLEAVVLIEAGSKYANLSGEGRNRRHFKTVFGS